MTDSGSGAAFRYGNCCSAVDLLVVGSGGGGGPRGNGGIVDNDDGGPRGNGGICPFNESGSGGGPGGRGGGDASATLMGIFVFSNFATRSMLVRTESTVVEEELELLLVRSNVW